MEIEDDTIYLTFKEEKISLFDFKNESEEDEED